MLFYKVMILGTFSYEDGAFFSPSVVASEKLIYKSVKLREAKQRSRCCRTLDNRDKM
jgi:hypothetical protein